MRQDMALTTSLPSAIAQLPPTPVLLLVLTISYLSSWIIYTLYFHPLSRFPGPTFACISRFWQIYELLQGHSECTHRSLHAKHGHLVRIAPNELSCSDPEAIKLIYNPNTPWMKSDWYDGWHRPGVKYQPLFTETNERVHAGRRRIVNPVYSMTSVLESEAYIEHCGALFLKGILEAADARQVVDLGTWIQM